MSAERATYVDSSAIVKLVVAEPESAALRQYLRGRAPLLVSALARTEITRALLPAGTAAMRRGKEVLARFELVRVDDRTLDLAGTLEPAELRSLDAIHLATAERLGVDLTRVVTYDERMARAASARGWAVVAPGR